MNAQIEPIKNESAQDYPALACPLCDTTRKPRSLNKDGSVTYSCAPDHINHGSRYTWQIAIDGSLVD